MATNVFCTRFKTSSSFSGATIRPARCITRMRSFSRAASSISLLKTAISLRKRFLSFSLCIFLSDAGTWRAAFVLAFKLRSCNGSSLCIETPTLLAGVLTPRGFNGELFIGDFFFCLSRSLHLGLLWMPRGGVEDTGSETAGGSSGSGGGGMGTPVMGSRLCIRPRKGFNSSSPSGAGGGNGLGLGLMGVRSGGPAGPA